MNSKDNTFYQDLIRRVRRWNIKDGLDEAKKPRPRAARMGVAV